LILGVLGLGAYGAGAHLSELHWSSTTIMARQPLGHPIGQVLGAVGAAVYLFIGFEWVTMMGFTAKAYERKIPISMPLAILTNVVAYCVFSVAMATRMQVPSITGTDIPQIPYFVQIFGVRGSVVGLVLSILAIVSCFNAGVMGGSRLVHALAREGNFPKSWGKISLNTGAPIGGVLALGVMAAIASVVIVRFTLAEITAVVGSAIVCFVYAAFMLAVLRLRKTHPDARRTFRSPLPVWLQWIMIGVLPVAGIGALFGLEGKTFYYGLETTAGLVLLSAATVWWSTRYKNAAMALQTKTS